MKNKSTLVGYTLLTAFFYLLPFQLCAQTTSRVEYIYDEAGNRKSRRIIVLTNSQNQTSAEFARPTESEWGIWKVVVYPNPTKGMLGVEVKGTDPKELITIRTYSLQGVLVNTEKGTGASLTRVDLSPFPRGQYILRVTVGDKNTEYKIIKE